MTTFPTVFLLESDLDGLPRANPNPVPLPESHEIDEAKRTGALMIGPTFADSS